MNRIRTASRMFLCLSALSSTVVLAQSRPSQEAAALETDGRKSPPASELIQRGKGREVARQLELEAAKRPDDPTPLLSAASTYEAVGDLAAAQAAAEKALERDANSIGALLVLGRIAIRQQRWNIAVTHLRRATLLDPRNRAAQLDFGQVLEKSGDQTGADAAYAAFESLPANET